MQRVNKINPLVSVIIPAYNEEDYIEATLKSLKNQTYSEIEIIVVCNGCIDKTASISKKYTKKIINLKRKNVSLARNTGAKSAKGKYLVFLDADTVLSNNVIEVITLKLNKGNYFGTCKAKPANKNLKTLIYTHTKNLINHFIPWSNGLIYCNAKIFKSTSGFNKLKSKAETRDIFNKLKKVSNHKYINGPYIITSPRRIAQWGILRSALFWIREKIKPTQKLYEAIR